MNIQSNAKKIIMGTVTAVYQPGWKVSNAGKEYQAGGKVLLDSKDGVCEVSFLQLYVDDKRTADMPQIWNDIDADWIKGKRIAIACVFDKDYPNPKTGEVKHQYKNPTDIQYLDGDEPETAVVGVHHNDDETKPTPVQHTFSLDERIAWNSSVNNAVQSHPFKGDPLDAEARSKWLGEIDVLALDIYPLIRRGYVEPEVEEVEPDSIAIEPVEPAGGEAEEDIV